MSQVAIQIKGLKKLQKACRQIGVEVGDKAATGALKAIHKNVAQKVIDWAEPSMPSVSGKFKGSYKAANQAKGAVVRSTLVYAGVNEFGGRIPNRGSAGAGASAAASKHARGSTGTHQHKPPMGGTNSYFVYPAVYAHESEIEDIYLREVKSLIDKHLGG